MALKIILKQGRNVQHDLLTIIQCHAQWFSTLQYNIKGRGVCHIKSHAYSVLAIIFVNLDPEC